MKKKHIGFIIAVLVLIACGAYYLIQKTSVTPARVVLNGTSFAVHIADTEEERAQGLSGVTFLDDHEGMLFIFDSAGFHKFWMKDMHFILDIIFIDDMWKVVHIEKSVSPETYPKTFTSVTPARYVVEVLAGTTDALDLQIGDTVTFINTK